jgi:hypothetical protein
MHELRDGLRNLRTAMLNRPSSKQKGAMRGAARCVLNAGAYENGS